jgi:hypothetical protein
MIRQCRAGLFWISAPPLVTRIRAHLNFTWQIGTIDLEADEPHARGAAENLRLIATNCNRQTN